MDARELADLLAKAFQKAVKGWADQFILRFDAILRIFNSQTAFAAKGIPGAPQQLNLFDEHVLPGHGDLISALQEGFAQVVGAIGTQRFELSQLAQTTAQTPAGGINVGEQQTISDRQMVFDFIPPVGDHAPLIDVLRTGFAQVISALDAQRESTDKVTEAVNKSRGMQDELLGLVTSVVQVIPLVAFARAGMQLEQNMQPIAIQTTGYETESFANANREIQHAQTNFLLAEESAVNLVTQLTAWQPALVEDTLALRGFVKVGAELQHVLDFSADEAALLLHRFSLLNMTSKDVGQLAGNVWELGRALGVPREEIKDLLKDLPELAFKFGATGKANINQMAQELLKLRELFEFLPEAGAMDVQKLVESVVTQSEQGMRILGMLSANTQQSYESLFETARANASDFARLVESSVVTTLLDERFVQNTSELLEESGDVFNRQYIRIQRQAQQIAENYGLDHSTLIGMVNQTRSKLREVYEADFLERQQHAKAILGTEQLTEQQIAQLREETLTHLNKTVDVSEFIQQHSSRALASPNTGQWEESITALHGTFGNLLKVIGNIGDKWREFAGVQILQTFNEFLGYAVQGLTQFNNWLESSEEATQKMSVSLAGLAGVTAVGSVFLLFRKKLVLVGETLGDLKKPIEQLSRGLLGTLLPALRALSLFLVTNPIGLVITGIATALVLLETKFDVVSKAFGVLKESAGDFFGWMGDWLGVFGDLASYTFGRFIDHITNVVSAVTFVGKQISELSANIWEAFTQNTAVQTLWDVWVNLAKHIGNVFDNIISRVTTFKTKIKTEIVELLEAIPSKLLPQGLEDLRDSLRESLNRQVVTTQVGMQLVAPVASTPLALNHDLQASLLTGMSEKMAALSTPVPAEPMVYPNALPERARQAAVQPAQTPPEARLPAQAIPAQVMGMQAQTPAAQIGQGGVLGGVQSSQQDHAQVTEITRVADAVVSLSDSQRAWIQTQISAIDQNKDVGLVTEALHQVMSEHSGARQEVLRQIQQIKSGPSDLQRPATTANILSYVASNTADLNQSIRRQTVATEQATQITAVQSAQNTEAVQTNTQAVVNQKQVGPSVLVGSGQASIIGPVVQSGLNQTTIHNNQARTANAQTTAIQAPQVTQAERVLQQPIISAPVLPEIQPANAVITQAKTQQAAQNNGDTSFIQNPISVTTTLAKSLMNWMTSQEATTATDLSRVNNQANQSLLENSALVQNNQADDLQVSNRSGLGVEVDPVVHAIRQQTADLIAAQPEPKAGAGMQAKTGDRSYLQTIGDAVATVRSSRGVQQNNNGDMTIARLSKRFDATNEVNQNNQNYNVLSSGIDQLSLITSMLLHTQADQVITGDQVSTARGAESLQPLLSDVPMLSLAQTFAQSVADFAPSLLASTLQNNSTSLLQSVIPEPVSNLSSILNQDILTRQEDNRSNKTEASSTSLQMFDMPSIFSEGSAVTNQETSAGIDYGQRLTNLQTSINQTRGGVDEVSTFSQSTQNFTMDDVTARLDQMINQGKIDSESRARFIQYIQMIMATRYDVSDSIMLMTNFGGL